MRWHTYSTSTSPSSARCRPPSQHHHFPCSCPPREGFFFGAQLAQPRTQSLPSLSRIDIAQQRTTSPFHPQLLRTRAHLQYQHHQRGPPFDRANSSRIFSSLMATRPISTGGQAWKLIHRYSVLAASGVAGPKLRQGDKQVPEGVYGISFLNPSSRYDVSLRVNYPNAFDRQMAAKDGRVGDRYRRACIWCVGA